MLKTRRGQPTSFWQISLRSSEGRRPASQIYNVQRLFYCRLDVRKYTRPGGPIQCHRCQDFGHGSSHCYRELRCVRCGDAHLSSLCHCQRRRLPRRGAATSSLGQQQRMRQVSSGVPSLLCSCIQGEEAYACPCKTQPPTTRGNSLYLLQSRTMPTLTPPTASQDEDDRFKTVRRRRHRPPRNPRNRGERSLAKKSEPHPPPAVRQPDDSSLRTQTQADSETTPRSPEASSDHHSASPAPAPQATRLTLE
ncbi:hypothetical protein J6590_070406 [Homalodisca vitripennis]|nr:hypothetical protein J6590_070406 [Homalodisca vitripennis]